MNRRWTLVLLSLAGLFWGGLAFAEGEPKGAVPASEAQAARAQIRKMFGFVPAFLNGMPDSALPGAWAEMSGLQMNPNTALPPKIKELIGPTDDADRSS